MPSPHPSDPPRIELSVVIVSHQAREPVLECLRSLRENYPAVRMETFLVDNASTDGTPAAVAAEFPEIQVIERLVNDGFSAANNAALRRARGELTLLLNPDTIVRAGAIDAMVSLMRGRPDAGIVGCRLENAEGATDPSAGGLPGLRMQVASLLGLRAVVPQRLVGWLMSSAGSRRAIDALTGGYFVPFDASGAPREVEFLSGACQMVRLGVWTDIGLLDEHFFLYLEDADLCVRARRAGWRLYYLPSATIVHLGGRSFAARSGGGTYHISRERAESLVYYFGKHAGAPGALAIRALLVAAVAPRLALAVWRDRRRAALLASILRIAVRTRRE